MDFLGIVHEVEPMIEIKTRAGKSMLKLNVWLADRSGGTICLVREALITRLHLQSRLRDSMKI